MSHYLNPHAKPFTPAYNYKFTGFLPVITYAPSYAFQGYVTCGDGNLYQNYQLHSYIPTSTYVPHYDQILDINQPLALNVIDPSVVAYATKQVNNIVNQTLYY